MQTDARQPDARKTQQSRPIQEISKDQQAALIQPSPGTQKENQTKEALQNTNARNRIARTDIGTEHQSTQDNHALEPTRQNWPVQETVIDLDCAYR